MKLTFATLAAALITTAASAMVTPSNVDPRDVAQNTLGQTTQGTVQSVSLEDAGLDARSRALITSSQVRVTSFEANQGPAKASDLR